MTQQNDIEAAEQLAARVKAAGLTMVEACRRAGVHPTTPSRWKSGKVPFSRKAWDALNRVVAEAEAAA